MKNPRLALNRFLSTVLLVALVTGCSCFRSAYDKSLAIWRSPDSSLDQRMDAASELISMGTKETKAQHILGEPVSTQSFYGAVFYAPGWPGYVSATNVAGCDIRQDIYSFAGGNYVALSFDMGAPQHKLKEGQLLGISIGNTNVDVFALTPTGKNF
jgi:hypothetical protein